MEKYESIIVDFASLFFLLISIIVECNYNILFLNIVDGIYFIFIQFGFVNVFFCLLALF